LAGFYGYKGDIGDETRRWNYAKLARDLTRRYWP
jgi:hypothetical protein